MPKTDSTGPLAGTPRLAVIGLGGTIAMTASDSAGAVPGLTAEDLLQTLPSTAVRLVQHVENFRRLPGAHLGLGDLVSLASRVRALSEQGEIDGAVVVQGTDTIEETVFALEILLNVDLPVVVTGAMRHAGQVSADGAANLAGALYTAASNEARGQGALVCFNDEVHAAWAAQKTASTNLAAFSSPGFGPVAHVIEGKARFLCRARRCPTVCDDPANVAPARVALLTASLGEGPELLEAVFRADYAGLVVAATGAGHLPESWPEPLAELAGKIPVILATRVSRGPILSETYGFAGSESDLLSKGLLSAGFLCASKARILLSMALGSNQGRTDIGESLRAFR
ncbi:MAG: asparaginase [Xanthomonadales bacterium]|nr:asparaginase [Gammaproteobacteria bacterium]NNL05533.1 asparaginase [Xanthomonadales bacterium]